MSNMSYKGYSGTIEVSVADNCLHGKILFINDMITYEGNSVPEMKVSFQEAVDRYLIYCEKMGKRANKPYSGTFNVRIGQELHKKSSEIASHRGMSLNDFVAQSIKMATERTAAVVPEDSELQDRNITTIEPTATLVDIVRA